MLSLYRGHLDKDGFALLPIHDNDDPPLWEALRELVSGSYTLKRAWKVSNPIHRDFYESGLERVATELKRIEVKQDKRAAHYNASVFPL